MANTNIYNMVDTWNNGATVFTSILMNVTDTAHASGSLLFDLWVGGATKFNIDPTGVTSQTGTSIITPAANTKAISVTGYSLTGTNTSSLVDLAGTWNVGTTVETAIKLNITDTASGATSLLMDLQVGGVSQLSVQKNGTTSALGSLISTSGNIRSLSNAGLISLGSANDVVLARDAAGILAQRNGVNAQTFRLYNTFTDASNYERGVFDWQATANTLTIGPQAAGTGTLRGVAAIGTWSFANAVMHTSSIALTNGAAAQLATITNGPTAGNPTKWVPINDNGTNRYIPAW